METTSNEASRASLALQGTLPKIKPEDAARLSVYLVQGDEVLAQSPVDKDRKFSITVNRRALLG